MNNCLNIRRTRWIANLLIVVMLITVSVIAFQYDTKYALSVSEEKPIYRGRDDEKKATIMFNVYWGTEYLDNILDVLDRYDVKTTFFVGGSWVEKNGEMLRKIVDKGHEIGNHGYFHKDQSKLDYNGNINEIKPNNLLIEKITQKKVNLFAPPSGAFSKSTLKAANDLGMTTIMWSKDTIDWRDKDTNLIIKRATKNIENGDLILAHPTKNTLEALPTIIKNYQSKGYDIVPVSQNIWGNNEDNI